MFFNGIVLVLVEGMEIVAVVEMATIAVVKVAATKNTQIFNQRRQGEQLNDMLPFNSAPCYFS